MLESSGSSRNLVVFLFSSMASPSTLSDETDDELDAALVSCGTSSSASSAQLLCSVTAGLLSGGGVVLEESPEADSAMAECEKWTESGSRERKRRTRFAEGTNRIPDARFVERMNFAGMTSVYVKFIFLVTFYVKIFANRHISICLRLKTDWASGVHLKLK